jgi:hypothetical protein
MNSCARLIAKGRFLTRRLGRLNRLFIHDFPMHVAVDGIGALKAPKAALAGQSDKTVLFIK